MTECTRCAHLPVCCWCADHCSEFEFPSKSTDCYLYNDDFDAVEEMVTIARAKVRVEMIECDNAEHSKFFRGEYSAYGKILRFMQERGNKCADD